MDATILGLSFSRNVIFYERLQGDATTVQRLATFSQRHANFRRLFLKVFIRKMTEPTIIKCKNYFRKVMGTMAKTKQESCAIIKIGQYIAIATGLYYLGKMILDRRQNNIEKNDVFH